jgi:hypothetical protein
MKKLFKTLVLSEVEDITVILMAIYYDGIIAAATVIDAQINYELLN